MNLLQKLRISSRLLLRDWRSGELSVILIALVIGISSHVAIGHFTDRLSRAMEKNARQMMGGDLVLGSSRAFDAKIRDRAETLGNEVAESSFFSTMISGNDEFLLVSVRTVSDNYPLKGSLRVARQLYGEEFRLSHPPEPGTLWAEPRILHQLDLKVGDKLTIGERTLELAGVLMYEPDRGNNFYGFTPRVIMHQQDLLSTNVVQPGSRVWYRIMLAGTGEQIESFDSWMQQRIKPGQRIFNLEEDRPGVNEALDKARTYMSLASLIALMLAAVAIANSSKRYMQRHYDNSALLRCLGCRKSDVLLIYLMQLCLLAIVGGILGNVLGWLGQIGLFVLIDNLVAVTIPAATVAVGLSAIALAVVVVIGTALPSLLQLRSVTPLRVLRQDLEPVPPSGWFIRGAALLAVTLLMLVYTRNIMLTLGMLAGGTIIGLLSAGILNVFFRALSHQTGRLPTDLQTGIRNFLRRRKDAIIQTMSFSLIIMTMLVIVLLRTELLSTWQNSIPEDAPNHFVLNIQGSDTDQYNAYLQDNGFSADDLFPVVRGRLTRINSNPVRDHVSKEKRDHNSLTRELNLTWTDQLPPDNKIIAGNWWSGEEPDNAVSVESELAENLDIDIGDTLTFFTGEREWEAVVSSIRTVEWDNFKPNFYMLFKQRALDGLPTTWINSFYLPSNEKQKLSALIRAFPSITLLEMDAIIDQVRTILAQVIVAIEAILLFILAAGMTVTLAAIQTTMDERIRESVVMRILGAKRALIRNNQLVEFATLGFIAGLFAVVGAELINALLQYRIFELTYTPTWWAWVLTPVASAILIVLIGLRSGRRVVRQNPVTVLGESR
ncbi:MAG: FtsX-like permease family protein [Pseudomonadota bacterium]